MPIRIQHILCPTDFSAGSRRALDYAVMLARWYHARLSVLHVHQLSMPVYGVSYGGLESMQPIVLTEDERQQLVARLASEVAADRKAAALSIDTLLDEAVRPAEAILARAEALPVDLIVMGTHGRSGVTRLMLGSVAEKVLRQARCPVLTVPPHAPDAVPRDIDAIRRILCPVDFSESSTRALEYAVTLVQEAHGSLLALHVLELPPDLSELPSGAAEYRDARFKQASAHLAQAVTTGVPSTCPVEEFVLVGKSYREILHLAGERAADLIVMGVQGRGVADLTFFGSTANHVVRGAHCPVLTIRSEKAK